MSSPNDLTICVLLYGPYSHLAQRCLESIRQNMAPLLPKHLRIGLNEPGASTFDYVQSLIQQNVVLPEHVVMSLGNIHKYPMMRYLLHGTFDPISTEFVMWFDDDSFIRSDEAGRQLLSRVRTRMRASDKPAMCGSIYRITLTDAQRQWIEDQPWFAGIPVEKQMRFATGGWWTARMDVLRRFDYPFQCLDHRGGDVVLGALCAQQRLPVVQFKEGVAINADEMGKESSAPRRGFDQAPCGFKYARSG